MDNLKSMENQPDENVLIWYETNWGIIMTENEKLKM